MRKLGALVFGLGIVLSFPLVSTAEEPTGFEEFPWGTPRKHLIPICGDPLLRLRGADELNCTERAPQIGERHWTPTLRFDDDDAEPDDPSDSDNYSGVYISVMARASGCCVTWMRSTERRCAAAPQG